MSFSGCEDFLWWFSERQAADPVFRQRLLDAISAGADPVRAVAEVIQEMDPSAAPLLATEVAELPGSALRTMLGAWHEAADEGLAFRARSVRPERPLEFARRRLVRVMVERDQTSVEVQLSHVPTRHPQH